MNFFTRLAMVTAALAATVLNTAPFAVAQAVETKVYVPPSSLVFRNLDSLAKTKVNWSSLITYNQKTNYSNKYTIALNLGTRVCDAFLTVQAQDKKNFNPMAMTVTGLSSKLGADIEQTINEKMFDLVKKDKWSEVRVMLDEQHNTVKERINKLDKDAAVLVTIGGWLEALNIVSKSLASNYNADATSLIRNAKLVEYLYNELNGLSAQAKGNDLVKKITAQLPELKTLVSVEKNKPVPLENVKKIQSITSSLVRDIENAKQ
jgi:hypothetical protein